MEQNQNPPLKITTPSSKQSCDVCGKVLSSFYNLQRHKVHIHKFPRPELISFNKVKEEKEQLNDNIENLNITNDLIQEEMENLNDKLNEIEEQISKIKIEQAQDFKRLKKYCEDLIISIVKS